MLSTGRQALDFFLEQSVMTSPGKHARLFDPLPAEIGELVRVVQGLLVYEDVAGDFYGYRVPGGRRDEKHVRTAEAMLARLLELDGRPLEHGRPVEKRLLGRCHHFVLLLVSMARAKGVPARARCGFGAYFNPGYFEDHWVVERWNERDERWVLVDPQFDDVWRDQLGIRHDVLDVPRDRFLVAADAWQRCRAGIADPATFGIVFSNLRGLWYVAGNLVRDLAALNKAELLPWDVWGAHPQPDADLTEDELELFDRLATLTGDPDAWLDDLRAVYERDGRLRVPETVFNALRERFEPVETRVAASS